MSRGPSHPVDVTRSTHRRGLRSGIASDADHIEEADISSAFGFTGLDASRLLDRRVLNVVAGIAIALAVMTWPERTDQILVRLIGIALLASFASMTWASIRQRPPGFTRAGLGVIGIVVGGLLVAFPDQSIVTVGRVLAVMLAVVSSLDLLGQFRKTGSEQAWSWPIAKAAAGIATASLIATYPSQLLALVTAVVALGWATVGVIAIVQSVGTQDDRMWRYQESSDLVIEWLERRPKEADDRAELYAKILYEGSRLRVRIVRFLALMTFASVIAAMGVITDSTAVVIGAMLIAPLMTPLMGVAISVVMGWPNRLLRHTGLVIAGVLLAIGIGVVLGIVAPTVIDVASNGQITARSEPTILDLITAVAAGAAGAYGLSRPDVSDSLPGVAIAISLVPPLSVVGIAYSQGAWSDGHGALLLFTTNALAIVIVGGFTFVLTGVTPIRRVAGNQQRVRTATASIVALGTIVVGALLINGAEITANTFEATSVDKVASDWAGDSEEYGFVQSSIAGDDVTIVLVGPILGEPPAEELHALVVERLGRQVSVRVRVVIEEVDVFPAE